MDIQAALKDGYTPDEIMAELGRRTGMNYQQALEDGHSPDDVLAELNRRDAGKKAVTEAPAPQGKTVGGFLKNVASDTRAIVGDTVNLLTPQPRKTSIAGDIGRLVVGGSEAAQRSMGLLDYPPTEEAKAAVKLVEPITKSIQDPSGIPGRLADYAYEKPVSAALVAAPAAYKPIAEVSNIVRDVNAVTGATGKLTSAGRSVGQLVKPKPTPEAALGQVLQGKTKDLAKGEKALAAINTEGIKTYADLNKKIVDAIPEYARKVDAELMRDANRYKLSELATIDETAGGATVTSNYVRDALDHLKELYGKIGDKAQAGSMDELLLKATREGLTKKEVNDIARKYGSEFGDKAFSKMDEPLTSVNAQAYENVRQGLKEVARRGLSDTAKELDSTISALYNTRRLIEKNVEAVNKLQQKVNPRGLGEKVGGWAMNVADAISLGTLRGAVAKIIPRNAGYKTMNALDLEEKLTRNLEIINEALVKAGEAPVALRSAAGKAVSEKATAMEEALDIFKKDEIPTVKTFAAGPEPNDLPVLKKGLAAVEDKISVAEKSVPLLPNIPEIQKALKGAGVPFLKQLNESREGFENRIVAQYRKSVGGELPVLPGREPPELKTLKETRQKFMEAIATIKPSKNMLKKLNAELTE